MVKIISDSTCDLSVELCEKYNVTILPLHVILGEEEHEDGVDITPDEIYSWSDANNDTPKTSAPSMDKAYDILKKFDKDYDHIIYFCISETMSASGNIVRLAAEDLGIQEKVTVINSKNLSSGIGYMVLDAAAMAQEGKEAKEIVDHINSIIPKIRCSFVIDTLVYLQRGGRCSGVAALVGGALKLHPSIVLEDGEMKVSKKYRGTIEKVYLKYVKDLEDGLKMADTKRVIFVHSGCTEDQIEAVRSYLESLGRFDEILVGRAGSVITSHCGPGTIGIVFRAK